MFLQKHTHTTITQPLLWGLLHGLNDFAAGFMLANYTYTHNYDKSFLLIIIYSVIGFGGQLPVGFWLDTVKQLKPFSIASLVLLVLAILTYFFGAEAGIILAGFASAFVHVTGGAVCLQVHQDKTGPLGLFTAPGVLGLTAGGLLGQFGVWQLGVIAALVVAVGILIQKNKLSLYNPPQKKESELDAHDWIMLGILLAMCFRSFLFDVINHVAQEYENGILIIGISAFAGKIIGGFVADKIGLKKFVYITLPIVVLLFQFGKENIYALGFGIACLQSSVPITLLLMSRSLPLYPATATALSLGVSIALAGLPLFLVSDKHIILNVFYNNQTTAIIVAALISTLLFTLYLLRRNWPRITRSNMN